MHMPSTPLAEQVSDAVAVAGGVQHSTAELLQMLAVDTPPFAEQVAESMHLPAMLLTEHASAVQQTVELESSTVLSEKVGASSAHGSGQPKAVAAPFAQLAAALQTPGVPSAALHSTGAAVNGVQHSARTQAKPADQMLQSRSNRSFTDVGRSGAVAGSVSGRARADVNALHE